MKGENMKTVKKFMYNEKKYHIEKNTFEHVRPGEISYIVVYGMMPENGFDIGGVQEESIWVKMGTTERFKLTHLLSQHEMKKIFQRPASHWIIKEIIKRYDAYSKAEREFYKGWKNPD